jgi:predicted alpha/beta superfamily hydrolase
MNEKANPVLTGEGFLSVPAVETHLLRSRHVQQTYKIQVMLPGRRKGDQRRCPVVYVTDGNWVFDMFKSISALLQMSADDAPPFILVSIGWPSESPHGGMMLRVREFTYPPYPTIDTAAFYEELKTSASTMPIYEDILLPEEGAKDFYGGEDFRRFIGEELIPFIDGKYPTVPGDRTYFGHSGGGFFGLFTLFTQPELFKNYLVSSPGLLFHDPNPAFGESRYENYDCGVQMARTFIDSGRSLHGIRLYMSAGAEEEFEPGLKVWRLVSGFYQFAKVITEAAIPGLEFMTEVFPKETHITVWPSAFIHGVQVALGTRRVFRSVYF